MKHPKRFWLLIAVLLAFTLRVYLLGAQSLWNDEGTSVALAALSLPAIANGAAHDIHPPLYYYLLHFWLPLAGSTEFAVRFLSVLAGTLLVVTTARLARMLFNPRVALIAAFLSALASFQVYYSQETRMYIWAALFTALSVWAMVMQFKIHNSKFVIQTSAHESRITNCESRIANLELRITNYELRPCWSGQGLRIWLLYLAATTAALYTHYFAATGVIFENLAFVVWLYFAWRSQRLGIRHMLVFWTVGQMLIGAAFLPWYFYAGNQLATWPAISAPFNLATLVWNVVNVFSVGLAFEGTVAVGLTILLGLVFMVGWLPVSQNGGNWRASPSPLLPSPTGRGVGGEGNFGIVLCILWVLVPLAVMYVVSLSRPAYDPKFLLLAMPPFFILASRGIENIGGGFARLGISRGVWVGATGLVLLGEALALGGYYFDPHYARDDYRAIVGEIQARAQADDAILVDAPGQVDVFRYYYRGAVPFYLLPRGRPPDPQTTRADINAVIDRHRYLYAIFWATEQADPQNIIGAELAARAFPATETWHGSVRFAVFALPKTMGSGTTKSVNARWGDEIVLESYQRGAEKIRAGEILPLVLNWRALKTPGVNYKVFVHLLDVGNRVVAQRDAEPVSGLRPTTSWRAGEAIEDRYGVFVPMDVAAGEYRMEIGIYRVDTGARLNIVSAEGQALGDHLFLDPVQVE